MRGVMNKDLVQLDMRRTEYYGYLDQTAMSTAYVSHEMAFIRRLIIVAPDDIGKYSRDNAQRVLVMGME